MISNTVARKVFFWGKFLVGFPQRKSHFGDVACMMVFWFQILMQKRVLR